MYIRCEACLGDRGKSSYIIARGDASARGTGVELPDDIVGVCASVSMIGRHSQHGGNDIFLRVSAFVVLQPPPRRLRYGHDYVPQLQSPSSVLEVALATHNMTASTSSNSSSCSDRQIYVGKAHAPSCRAIVSTPLVRPPPRPRHLVEVVSSLSHPCETRRTIKKKGEPPLGRKERGTRGTVIEGGVEVAQALRGGEGESKSDPEATSLADGASVLLIFSPPLVRDKYCSTDERISPAKPNSLNMAAHDCAAQSKSEQNASQET